MNTFITDSIQDRNLKIDLDKEVDMEIFWETTETYFDTLEERDEFFAADEAADEDLLFKILKETAEKVSEFYAWEETRRSFQYR